MSDEVTYESVDDGAPQAPEVTLTAYPTPPGQTFEEWSDTLVAVATRGKAAAWHIGDLLVAGGDRFGEDVSAVLTQLEALGYTQGQLSGWEYTCRNVPAARRRAGKVDISQHREVAKLDPEAQAAWLETCERESLSIAALRKRLTEAGLRKSRGGSGTAKSCEGCDQYAEQVAAMRDTINAMQARLARYEGSEGADA